MTRKTRRDIDRYTGSVIQLGIGTAITASMPGTGAAKMAPAFGTAASMMRPLGVGMMGGNVIRMTKKLYKKKRKRRR